MRGILIGVAVGLIIGGGGALAYSHYLGEGRELAKVQADLDAARADATKTVQSTKELTTETQALSDQVKQLSSTNDDLKQKLNASTTVASPAPPAPAVNPMAGMMKAGMAMHQQQRLILLKSRLHLTPDQEAAVKAAMDEEGKRMEEMAAKMMQGGKMDPQAMAALRNGSKSLDQTLDGILTPDQKTAYTQMKTDEKNSAADMSASFEMNQMTPLLQLSDTQKDQVYSALYQVQQNMQDPNYYKNNTPDPSNPTAILDAQAKAKEDALAKILTPDQLATYHQQAQSQLEMQKTMMQKFMPPGGGAPVAMPPPPGP